MDKSMHVSELWSAVGRGLLWAVAAACLQWPAVVEARIVSLTVTRTESPTFGGTSFGDVGPYEKLVGVAVGEVDPGNPGNAPIVDLALAPRNVRGMVEFSTPFFILRPLHPERGNRRLFYDINNRGDHVALGQFNDAPPGNDPSTATDAGQGYLMRMGYTIVLSGWDFSAASGDGRLALSVPVARNIDGTPIVGLSLAELVVDGPGVLEGRLTYKTLSRSKSQASLTVRHHFEDAPQAIPDAGWEFVDEERIRLLPAGRAFDAGSLYEFTYVAKDPRVAGLAFAAVRDLIEFLRHDRADSEGRPNPLAGQIDWTVSFSMSQPSRFLHDLIYAGFNEDSRGRRVFDGVLSWIGGGSGGFFNYRFAQPGRTHRQHIGRWYPERRFPFADATSFDAVTGRTDGRLAACTRSRTCPRIFEVNSENEYWAKAGSLLHTDTQGRDLADPPDVRHFLLSSLPHSRGRGPSGPGLCQLPRSPVVANATLRALLVALGDWVVRGAEPPASQVPRVADGTLVPSWPQASVGFPQIPGVTFNGRLHEGDAWDFGDQFTPGVLNAVPPVRLGAPYPALVPKTDADGIDIAGIHQVEVAVPLATFTGWALRAGAASGDGCDDAGQQIDFAPTRAARLAAGDPRLSLDERYPTRADYVEQVRAAARNLERQRFMLAEDVDRAIQRARTQPLAHLDGR